MRIDDGHCTLCTPPISDYEEVIPVKSIVGDIRKLAEVSRALQGADCVLHIAAIISIGTFPDVKAMQAINVDGKVVWLDFTLPREILSRFHLPNRVIKFP